MQDRVIIQRDQQITDEDLNNMGLFPQAAFDLLVREAIEPGLKYTGFNVVESGPAQVVVGAGAVWSDGRVFIRNDEAGVEIDMLANLPAVGNKYVAIVAWGDERDTEVEPRTFLLDPISRATEARAVATVRTRYANVDKVIGTESTSPVVPPVGADIIVVAHVLLSPTGILSITRVTDNELVSSRDNANALIELGLWRAQTGARLETIETDVTGLSESLRGAAKIENLFEVSRDVAVLKSKVGLPEDYSSYGYDPFLVLDQSETDAEVVTGQPSHPNLDCLVEEGLRFAPFAIHTQQLELLNSDDVKVRRQDNFIMPAFTEVARISSIGRDDEISLAQYENQTVEMVQKMVSRQRVRYGGFREECTNAAWWKSGQYDPVSGIFKIGNESFEVLEFYTRPSGSIGARLRQYWVDYYDEPYWDAVTTTSSVNGSVVAQTFLNSQETWLTAIGLYFTRKGNANVELALTEVTEGGAPDMSKVIARTTLAAADIQLYPLQTKVPFPLTLLTRGERYAIVPISTGAHYLALTQSNKFTQGSLFYSTDGSWFQGDLVKDLSFVIFAAKFSTPRVEVQLQAWELAGGIFDIDILADAIVPDGTSLTYDVRVNNVWVPLSGANLDALSSLPPLLQARAVFQGTTDLMPRLGLAARSQVKTMRPKTSFVHITDAKTPPAPVNTVWVDIRLEAWDGDHNTAVVKLLSGAGYATVTDAAVVEEAPDERDPRAITRRYIFTLGAPISSFKIRTEGTTDSIMRCFHVAFRQHVSLKA